MFIETNLWYFYLAVLPCFLDGCIHVADDNQVYIRESREIWGAFHSTRISENFETVKNGTKVSWENFQKSRKLLNFRKENHSPKILEIPGGKSNGREIPGKKFLKILVNMYLMRLSSSPEILKNAVQFVTGNFRKFKPHRMESDPGPMAKFS